MCKRGQKGCDKQNTVYKITCKACKPEAVSIGMCAGVLRFRVTEYVSKMKMQKQGPLGTHAKNHHSEDPQEPEFDIKVLGEWKKEATRKKKRKAFKSQYAAACIRWSTRHLALVKAPGSSEDAATAIAAAHLTQGTSSDADCAARLA